MRTLCAAIAAAITFSSTIALADPPKPEEVKAVWDFFEHGKGQGPILADAKVCTDIGKTGDTKGECTQEIPADGVRAGTTVYLWQAYMLPKDDEVGDITVQVKQGDLVRETKDVSIIKGTYWRERTWSGVTLRKPGTWTLTVMRGDKALKSFTVKVQ